MAAIRLLIIDDNELSRTLLRVIFRNAHFDVVGEAGNVRDGISLAQKHKPDVVLLDIVMPGAMGMDAINPIKACHPQAFIIIVSANDDDELVADCMKKGAEDFIVKPFKTAAIVAKIKKLGEKIRSATSEM